MNFSKKEIYFQRIFSKKNFLFKEGNSRGNSLKRKEKGIDHDHIVCWWRSLFIALSSCGWPSLIVESCADNSLRPQIINRSAKLPESRINELFMKHFPFLPGPSIYNKSNFIVAAHIFVHCSTWTINFTRNDESFPLFFLQFLWSFFFRRVDWVPELQHSLVRTSLNQKCL